MIVLDTNILIDLLVSSQEGHKQAWVMFESMDDPPATTHVNIAETLRLLTHFKIFKKPLKMDAAIDLIESFLDAYQVSVLQNSEGWWKELRDIGIDDLRGNDIFDAQIALCLKYNGVRKIWTKDSDFRKYPFLKVSNSI